LNLIHNAITFTPEKGTITLDSTRDDTYVYLKITDLGLSLVKNITELHGGYVDIESAQGSGTNIIVALPVDPVLEPLL